ncbi:MAG: hypothetical protein Q4D44_05775 [Eubacteriales bacterium]|nr:hypothetical protein [Eubacteriales bacterium]
MDTENKDLFENTENTAETETETPESFSTLDVSKEDLAQELENFGITDESFEEADEEVDAEEQKAPKKKCPVQVPIIISAVALVLVAAIVFGSVFVFNTFFKDSIDGVWTLAGSETETGMYLIFEKNGEVTVDYGANKYYGHYELVKPENEDEDLIIKSDLLCMMMGVSNANMTFSYGDTKDTMTVTYVDYGVPVEFKKTKLPKIEEEVTALNHASADELGIKEVNIDEKILGSWTEETYGTYTFDKNGTGSYEVTMQNGSDCLYVLEFNYTVYEDEILLTAGNYVGDPQSGTMQYYLDKGNLVIDGIGFRSVK